MPPKKKKKEVVLELSEKEKRAVALMYILNLATKQL
jgi:hypothetical protein